MPEPASPPEGYAAARESAVLFDQSPRGKVEVAGRDAARFLHNLCSNDVNGLAPGAGCETFLATVKARMVAHLFLFRGTGGSLWLDMVPGLAGKVVAHLDRYLISEQVELADRTAELAQLYLAGPQAAELLQRALGIEPPGPLCMVELPADESQPRQVRRRDVLCLPGFDVLCAPDAAAALGERLVASGARPAAEPLFEVLRIEAGMPVYGVDLDDNTFAPEAGRTAEAISYNKGCYLGQEPIVMARDRGQINRTLRGVKLPAGPVPMGSLLYREGKEAGRCLSCTHSPRLGIDIALAFVRRGSWDPGTALEVEVSGQRQPAEVAALPFVTSTPKASS
jgi:folate-binding protein YgfZ